MRNGEKTISLQTEKELLRTFQDWTKLWEQHSAYFINQTPTTKTEAILMAIPKYTIALNESAIFTRFINLRYYVPELNNFTESLYQLKNMLINKGTEALSNNSDPEDISRIIHSSYLPNESRKRNIPMESYYSSLANRPSEIRGELLSGIKNIDMDSVEQQEVEKLFHNYLEEHLKLRLHLGYTIDKNLKITDLDFSRVSYSLSHIEHVCLYMAFITNDRSWIDFSRQLLQLEKEYLKIILNRRVK
ncbi:MAG: hypothetical protein JXB49_20125 [Bacteroidales bacterium]|nr:hypothetical protein [Bacteroidales bacterium]